MNMATSFENKQENYQKVIQIHLEKGPVDHDYTFGFLCEILNDAISAIEGRSQVVYCQAPFNVCGDIRSRYSDLLEIFKKCGWPFDTKYMFLGNVIDGSRFSLETLVLLLSCKIAFPDNFVILRGYLENIMLTTENSFVGEFRVRFPNSNQWKILSAALKKFIQRLPLVAILNSKIICLNSVFTTNVTNEKCAVTVKNGVSNGTSTTKIEIKFLPLDTPQAVTPKKIEENAKRLKDLLNVLDMSLMINSNDVIPNGYNFSLNHSLLTITSGSKISKKIDNRGVVMMMDCTKKTTFKKINSAEGNIESQVTLLRC
ncbi:unnamed protein product [Caenorhabditis angaria]|uniref:Serine/threonine specific protein phosphatases domain-containing protein n=1 Tax=Caenorhabditis angaria TaxID=860376 RepID=A0A9P1IU40_9PELO|nr:unnamed protein product [Caenorhabditis angaria]